MSIVKRRKTVKYAQIHNNPLQNLEDIRSIGLIAHLMSLPEDWEIRKMQLYSKFGRAAISHGVKELEEKKYWIDIKYRIGKNNEHIYHISDVPFEDNEVLEILEEVVIDYKVMSISPPFDHLLSSDEIQQLNEARQINVPSSAHFQQLNINCSSSTVEKEHLSNKKETNKINTNKNIKKKHIVNNIVNKEETINNLITEYRLKGLSKDVCLMVLDEVEATPDIKNFGGYLRTCLDNALYKSKLKSGQVEPTAVEKSEHAADFYNWLEK